MELKRKEKPSLKKDTSKIAILDMVTSSRFIANK
jgi:hypothetical protein